MLLSLLPLASFAQLDLTKGATQEIDGIIYTVKTVYKTETAEDKNTVSMIAAPSYNAATLTVPSTVSFSVVGKDSHGDDIDMVATFAVDEIVDDAFKGQSVITAINFADNSNIEKIGTGAFEGVSAASINLSGTKITVLKPLFNSAANGTLTSITLPATLTEIAANALENCAALTTVDLSACANLATIGNYAFGTTSQLTTLDFSACTKLVNIATTPFITGTTPNQVLTTVTLPASIKTIGTAFAKLPKLTALDLSGTALTGLVADCLSGSVLVTSLTLPNEAWTLAQYALRGSKVANLTITCNNNKTQVINDIYGTADADKTTLKTLTFDGKFKGSIADNAFKGLTGLQTVSFDTNEIDGSIGESAFEGCTALATLTMSGELKGNIGASAFKGCTALGSLTLGKLSANIGANAFDGCTALATLTTGEIADGKSIGANAFDGCTALASVEFGKIAGTIAGEAFNGCTNLATVTTGATSSKEVAGTIANDAFKGCTKIATVTFGNVSGTINAAFPAAATAGAAVTMGNVSGAINDGAFANAASVIMGDVTGTLGAAFTKAGSVTINKINLSGAATIAANAFRDVTSLTITNGIAALGTGTGIAAGAFVCKAGTDVTANVGNIDIAVPNAIITAATGKKLVMNVGAIKAGVNLNTAFLGNATTVNFSDINGTLVGTDGAAVVALTEVNFNGAITTAGTIGEYAFAAYTKLAKVTFATSILMLDNAVAAKAFYNTACYAGSAAEGGKMKVFYKPTGVINATNDMPFNVNAFAEAAYAGADNVELETIEAIFEKYDDTFKRVAFFVELEKSIEVAKLNGDWYYGKFYDATNNYKISKADGNVIVYSAYVDESDAKIYMDQL